MSDHPTVAVVGAGFSGLLTALRLLLTPEGPRVVLIEKGPRFGRGTRPLLDRRNPEAICSTCAPPT